NDNFNDFLASCRKDEDSVSINSKLICTIEVELRHSHYFIPINDTEVASVVTLSSLCVREILRLKLRKGRFSTKNNNRTVLSFNVLCYFKYRTFNISRSITYLVRSCKLIK